jgi:hypothetical protein
MNVKFRKLGWLEWRWLGVFIASNHFLAVVWVCCRWAHQTVQWCTGQSTVHCPVRATSAHRWGLERLTVEVLHPVAAPDSPVHSDFAAWYLTSALCAFTVHAVDRWVQTTVASLAHRPVNYSEARLWKTRELPVWVVRGLGHRTLSGAPLAAPLQVFAPNFVESPTSFLSWFMLNLMHLR